MRRRTLEPCFLFLVLNAIVVLAITLGLHFTLGGP